MVPRTTRSFVPVTPVDRRDEDHLDQQGRSSVSGLREIASVEKRANEDLRADERGAAYVEYLVVATLVTIVGAAAVITLGVPLYGLYRYVEMTILLPVP